MQLCVKGKGFAQSTLAIINVVVPVPVSSLLANKLLFARVNLFIKTRLTEEWQCEFVVGWMDEYISFYGVLQCFR